MTRVTPLGAKSPDDDGTFVLPHPVVPGPARIELEGGGFGISKQGLADINIDQMTETNMKNLQALGGVDGLAKKLHVDTKTGLSRQEVDNQFVARRATYGTNTFVEAPSQSFLSLFLDCFKDTTLIILNIAAMASIATGMIENPEHGWVEGFTILVAVVLVAFVSSVSNYTKELQFRALNAKNDEFTVKVLRAGSYDQVPVADINVGDIVVLESGDKVPADAVFLRGQDVKCNESSLTGEPDEVTKGHSKDPFLLSGCLLASGRCEVIITAIGSDSRWGRIKAKLVREHRATPLMEKLDDMVKVIGYGGMGCAIATMIAMVSIYATTAPELRKGTFTTLAWSCLVLTWLGLPLAVTISLSYSTKKMLNDHNLIRVLAACETMGNCTSICSDKTGTLTENRMTVVELWTQGKHYDAPAMQSPIKLDTRFFDTISTAICANSTAQLLDKGASDVPIVQGNKTEGALLLWLRQQGVVYKDVRDAAFRPHTGDRMYTFSSERKSMSTIVRSAEANNNAGGFRLYSKGAAEIILTRCTHVLKANGTIGVLNKVTNDDIHDTIVSMAKMCLRTMCVAFRDFAANELPSDLSTLDNPPEGNMVCCAIFGIMDPLRADVADSVQICQRAGITVRMVTGDNIHTARAIAKQCGILTADGVALEGPVFRQMPKDQLLPLLPKLQVLARSSPDDKHMLVTMLRARQEVVGVTGDGTNDAPALRAADVGLAMGIAGTDLAKEAADIIIMDDRFASIKQSVLWGRCVYDNIRKFVQFQLTVNVVALALTFLGALTGFDPPLNAVMMLWVNLIMDTMGALALGTEVPKPELLLRRPYKKDASLLSRIMIKHILVQSAFQLTALLTLLFLGPGWLGVPNGNTCVSATYAWIDDAAVVSAKEPCFLLQNHSTCGGVVNCSMYLPLYPTFNDTHTVVPNVPADCLVQPIVCDVYDYRHFTFIFNVFVFAQVFNEINARSVTNDWRVLNGFMSNSMFLFILVMTIVCQVLIVEFGGNFTKTSPLDAAMWGYSVAIGFLALPLGVAMRFIPVQEDPTSFANPNGLTIVK
ncbi:hypothetical protein DYB32_001924 [Aphanomyces invadans]|uniref:Calcium-transporting ATPase n=1 Tax=Aphanomyces invadans TaxID=157072 RepID=A0A3R6W1N6_9STRA|nr:hypothetical protein DYB32_001924 [Aphanomyces invadans]